jgi:SAM-dependent methyltransferase
MTPAYRNLGAGADDVIVDIGCGPGDALKYLKEFREFHGFDTDPVAIAFARRLAADRRSVHFESRAVTGADLEAIRPTRVAMNGLLHHLSDDEALDLLSMCGRIPSIRRIATQDVVLLPRQRVSNLLARLDRGKHVRDVEGYRTLALRAGLTLAHEQIVRSHPTRGLALYLLMALGPTSVPSR